MPASIPYPPTDGTLASGTQMNANLIALLAAITNSVLRDGTLPMTGNLSFGGNKGTNLANATLAGDAVAFGQLTALLAPYAPLAAPAFTGTILGAAATLTGLLTLGAGLTVTGAVAVTGNVAVTGTLSATGAVASLSTETGYRDIPMRTLAGAGTLALADRGSGVYYTGGAAAITVPPNASVAFPYGALVAVVLVVNDGTGVAALTQGAGVTLVFGGTGATGNRNLAIGGMASLTQVALNRWFVSGPGVS